MANIVLIALFMAHLSPWLEMNPDIDRTILVSNICIFNPVVY